MIQVHIVYAHSTFDQARHLDKTAGHVLCWTGFRLGSGQGPRDGRTATRLKLRQDWNSLVKRRMSVALCRMQCGVLVRHVPSFPQTTTSFDSQKEPINSFLLFTHSPLPEILNHD
jgi:hypothetical protein